MGSGNSSAANAGVTAERRGMADGEDACRERAKSRVNAAKQKGAGRRIDGV